MGWGKVSVRRGNVFGPVVNTARRLVREACPGEILVTADLEVVARKAPDVCFEPTSLRVFRGIDGYVGAYRLVA
jgi:class 3 adenylate cyclase